jgi:hypothetical protein
MTMSHIFKYFKILLISLFVLVTFYLLIEFYPFIFSRKVVGVLDAVERVNINVSLLQTGNTHVNPEFFSFAIGIKEKSGEIVTSSAEDRQWMAAKPGLCVEARYYPYPPWRLDKSGTYFGARLLKMHDCSAETK